MTDIELAQEIERYLAKAPRSTMVLGYAPAVWQQIIAALRRGPERPPSGEMVMVSREPTSTVLLALSGTYQREVIDKAPAPHMAELEMRLKAVYRAMLSAAEAEGRISK